jgi:RNA polymerase sigma-70 factor (ECF subfamily)
MGSLAVRDSLGPVNPAQMILEARSGSGSTLGALLELYRNYLRLLARAEIGRQLQGKVDPSDLIQETFLDAQLAFPRFAGGDEPQFVRWLRRILATKVANLVRRYRGTRARDVLLEEDIASGFDRSSCASAALAASIASPSQQAARREQSVLLADAIARLPEHYREAIILRHFEGLTFPQIAAAMGRSEDSVEKLWIRALGMLRTAFGGDG